MWKSLELPYHTMKHNTEMCIHIRGLMIYPCCAEWKKWPFGRVIFLPRAVVGLIRILSLSNLMISVHITLFFSTLSCPSVDNPTYISNQGNAFIFVPCDRNHSCNSANQQWLSPCNLVWEHSLILRTFAWPHSFMCTWFGVMF